MNKLKLVEVGTRDGFQNVEEFIPTEIKLQVVDKLAAAGVSYLQLTSFVSPKAIPQLRDAAEVVRYALEKYPRLAFSALAPNLKGAQNAWDCGLRSINFVISVSESHNQNNVRRSVRDSFAELERIVEQLPDMEVTLDAATAFGCPFEGSLSYPRLRDFVGQGGQLGINEFSIADTIGIATPDKVETYLQNLHRDFPDKKFGVHIHDTRNMGMVNTFTAIRNGASMVQSSIGGLGGCPFAPGASGNLATEDLIYMLNAMGYETGVDFEKLMLAARFVKEQVKGNFSGHQIFIDHQNPCGREVK